MSNQMENKKLVETVAANLGRTQKDVSKLLEAFAGVLRTRCGDMDSVYVPSFGTFEPKKRNERVMVHPRTGKRMLVPPKVVLGFKMSNVLKSKLK
jgi:nucleoid DNA-binding protein